MAERIALNGETRVTLRYRTLDVPGAASDRGHRVANDFAVRHFHRPFNYTTDLVHLPCDFDSTERKNVWVLCDFNIQEPLDQSG